MERAHIDNLGIPPLAGICTYEEACRAGYDVDHTVELLKRYNYVEARLNEILVAHLARTPEWEVKCAVSLHTWLDAEHSASLRQRVAEMREPPLQLDKVPDPRLQAWLEEVIRATNTVELLVGIYRVVKPELVRAWKKHLAETNPLADHPTCRILKLMLGEEEEMIAWGEQAIAALTQTDEAARAAQAWETHLRWFLRTAGGVAGDLRQPEDQAAPRPRSDGTPYEVDPVPRRDARFADPYNRRFTFRDASLDAEDPIAVLLVSRLREMDVPEFLVPIIATTKGRPWEYYVDMSRQVWDEARHAMMGEAGLYQNGVPFYKYPVELQGSMSLNTEFEPLEAHILLWGIEQSLMRRDTGKARELGIARASGNELLATFQDYDWADEVLHAQIGRRWLLPEVGSMVQMRAAYQTLMRRWDESMAKLDVLSDQAEWWPTFLAEIRRRRQELGLPYAARTGPTQAPERSC